MEKNLKKRFFPQKIRPCVACMANVQTAVCNPVIVETNKTWAREFWYGLRTFSVWTTLIRNWAWKNDNGIIQLRLMHSHFCAISRAHVDWSAHTRKVLNRYRLNREITANTQAGDDSNLNLRPTDSNNRSVEVIKMEMRWERWKIIFHTVREAHSSHQQMVPNVDLSS